MTKIHDVEQGGAEWFKLRAGIPTASEFDCIITPTGKKCTAEKRQKYMARLIAARLLNWQAHSLEAIKHIEDGKIKEPFAAKMYEVEMSAIMGRPIKTEKIGFLTTDDGRAGASPDRIVSGLPIFLEAKCPTIPVHMYYLAFGHVPEYRPQVMGQLYVGKELAERGDFISFEQRCPPWITTTEGDKAFLKSLHEYLQEFLDDLDAATERVRSLGTYQAFEALQTPLDAERGDSLRRDPLASAEELAGVIEATDEKRYAWGG
jgi:hypothetical protein